MDGLAEAGLLRLMKYCVYNIPMMMASFRYTNSSSQFLILKLTDCHWERTLVPGQTLTFTAAPESHLEIYSPELAGCVLEDRIPCQQLERHYADQVTAAPMPRSTHKVPALSAA